MYNLPENAILYASDWHGIYIPQYFAESIHRYSIANWSKWVDDLDALCIGPDRCEYYWDIWEDMLNRMEIRDNQSGIEYSLYQDGHLWLVPTDWQPSEE